jgi:hypothetical protein
MCSANFIGSTVPVKTVNGITFASLPLPPLGAATYTFAATYNGDAGDLPSTGSTTFVVRSASAAVKAAAVALATPTSAAPIETPPRSTSPAPATVAARFGIGPGQSKPRRPRLAAPDLLDAERQAP